jgi:hypothetical protein
MKSLHVEHHDDRACAAALTKQVRSFERRVDEVRTKDEKFSYGFARTARKNKFDPEVTVEDKLRPLNGRPTFCRFKVRRIK